MRPPAANIGLQRAARQRLAAAEAGALCGAIGGAASIAVLVVALGACASASSPGRLQMQVTRPEPKSATYLWVGIRGAGQTIYGLRNTEWLAGERVAGPNARPAECHVLGDASGPLDPFPNDGQMTVDWKGAGVPTDNFRFRVEPGWYRVVATFSPDSPAARPRRMWRCTSAPFHVDKPEPYMEVE